MISHLIGCLLLLLYSNIIDIFNSTGRHTTLVILATSGTALKYLFATIMNYAVFKFKISDDTW